MKFTILAILFAFSASAFAESKLIINNQAFDIVPEQPSPCSDGPGGPEYQAALFAIKFAKDLGERAGGPKNGMNVMFSTIRRYPSRFKQPKCAAPLRDECEKICNGVNGMDPLECKIQCNQYERWNG